MKRHIPMKKKVLMHGLALTTMLVAAEQASAVSYNLCAGVTSATMPDGAVVSMWGYGTDDGSPNCASATVPGPQLSVPVGDTALTINLRNTLAAPASVMVPGLSSTTAPQPVFFTDGQGRSRARSFTAETATGATGSYSFVAKPGTYLYHSGTHPAVQVQMGLYGGVTQDAAVGQAYAGVNYDSEVVLIYSEIDTALHAAVSGGTYGTAAYPSTIDYKPGYFLVNGQPYNAATADIAAGGAGDRVLIRFLNAGLETHVPTLVGQDADIVAEHGHAYPYPRTQTSVMLAAGQTRDAIMTPLSEGTISIFDRRLRLSNANRTTGGMLSKLVIGAGGGGGNPPPPVPTDAAPVAVNDIAAGVEDSSTIVAVTANDTDDFGIDPTSLTITAQALNGVATTNTDGSVTYTPNANFNGADSFSYTVRDTIGQSSNQASVSVTVTAVNDAPVASNDNYSIETGVTLVGNVTDNDNDVDGDVLTATVQTTTANGSLVLNADGSFSYTANAAFTGVDSFSYLINDGSVNSNVATVSITVTAVVTTDPVANDDYVITARNTAVTIPILANDTDADGTLNPNTVGLKSEPNNGAITGINPDGSVVYTPRAGFTGSDTFSYTVQDDQENISNEATVRVDVLAP